MYGIGILGNCCTHGAGAADQFNGHPETRIITGFEKKPGRARELEAAMGVPLAKCYEDVIACPDVQIVAVTSDPSDKADLVAMAAKAGKALFINKPLCHTAEAARRVEKVVTSCGLPAVFDAPMIKSLTAYNRLMSEVREGRQGRVISYYHSFGMLFEEDFPIAEKWPERFDPPSISGGGEMTNMGCYAIDFALHVLGIPRQVEARSNTFWAPYRDSGVENFGQLILDYGDFWAILAVGKQTVTGPRGHRNSLFIEFEHTNLFLDPEAGIVLENGMPRATGPAADETQCVSAIDQLIASIEGGLPPGSDIVTAARGVEVLTAAYQSVASGSAVPVPSAAGTTGTSSP